MTCLNILNIIKRFAGLAAAMALSCVVVGAPAAAEPFPSRPVRFVVGSSPGDNTDIFARLIADELKGRLGQPVIVENKPGAAGLLSGIYVSGSKADGYTLLFGHMSSVIVGPQTVNSSAYDSTSAFTPIVKTQQGASVLVVRSSLPAKTLKELIELARSKPKQVSYAVNSTGSTQHLAMEIVQARTGVRLNTVPYRGTAASLQAVVSGEADIAIAGALVAKPHIESGAIRALALYGGTPSPQYPGLATMGKVLNVPELDHDFWYGVLGPAGLERDVVAKLSTEIRAVMGTPKIQEMLAKNAQTFVPNSPEDFAKAIASEWNAFGGVAREYKKNVK